jgi:hypothetical protein
MSAPFPVALRQLTRQPGFTVLVIVMLALGIGASTALFSTIQHALWNPLPFPDADRLVRLWAFDRSRGITHTSFSFVRFDYIRQRQQSFSELVGGHDTSLTLTAAAKPNVCRRSRFRRTTSRSSARDLCSAARSSLRKTRSARGRS